MNGLVERRFSGREALEVAARVVHDHGGQLEGWLAVCRGVWERIEREAAERAPAAVAAGREAQPQDRGLAV